MYGMTEIQSDLVREYGDIPNGMQSGTTEPVFHESPYECAQAIEKTGEIESRHGLRATHKYFVADTGSGIPEDTQKRIFRALLPTKEIGKGTGLGLSIALRHHKKTWRRDISDSVVRKAPHLLSASRWPQSRGPCKNCHRPI